MASNSAARFPGPYWRVFAGKTGIFLKEQGTFPATCIEYIRECAVAGLVFFHG
jgi:hypothetical protein